MKAVWAGVALAALVAVAPAGSQTSTPTSYLPRTQLPNSLTLLPPPPAKGSGAEKRDKEAAAAAVKLHGGPRWDLATEDANLAFPRAAGTYSCALGVPVTEADTPTLYRLLRRSYADLGPAPYPTKNKYMRPRPFTVNKKPLCTPEIEAALRKDGSYPSGHATIGWGWALILAEAAPDRADAVLARGRAYTESRRICNVHWLSDVEEGRTMASAVVAKLHDSADFRADVATAKAEIAAARAKGLAPSRDCDLEASRLAVQ